MAQYVFYKHCTYGIDRHKNPSPEELYHCQQAYRDRTTGELGSISGGEEVF
jgi:hypothetical protein